jgi:hypothetical protein
LAYRFENPTAEEAFTNKCLSSCRECIEWHYGEIGQWWAFFQHTKLLKIRQVRVADMYRVAILLRNLYVTMNGNKTAEYFDCRPPSFDEFVAHGPRNIE